jgi:hypothetical protein
MTIIPQERIGQGAWLTGEFPDACGHGEAGFLATAS